MKSKNEALNTAIKALGRAGFTEKQEAALALLCHVINDASIDITMIATALARHEMVEHCETCDDMFDGMLNRHNHSSECY